MAKKIPMRMCIGCQEMLPKTELIRVLKLQDETFCIDTTGKKNGRGAYLCKKEACFDLAIKRKGLERSFKRSIPKEMMDALKKEMSELAK